MRLQAGPRENDAGNEREDNAAHKTQHPGRPIGTPKVDYRRAAQASICHFLPPSAPVVYGKWRIGRSSGVSGTPLRTRTSAS
jgi:hypothetical protein